MNKFIIIVLLHAVSLQASPTLSAAMQAEQQAQQQHIADVHIQDANENSQRQTNYFGSRWVKTAAGVVAVAGVCAWALYEYVQDMACALQDSSNKKRSKQNFEDSYEDEMDDQNDC